MAFTPHRLQVGTNFEQSIPLLNDNFDQAVQDMRDLGSATSTSTLVTFSLASGDVAAQTVVLVNPGDTSTSAFKIYTAKPVARVADAQEFCDIWIDTVSNDAYRWPEGGSLSAAQKKVQITVTKANTTFAGSLAAFVIQLRNTDTGSHDYYVQLGCWYIPMSSASIYR